MFFSSFDQAQTILLLAIAAGTVIGVAVLVGARRNAAGPTPAGRIAKAQPSVHQATTPKRALPKDTRQRAIDFIDEISTAHND